MRGGTLPETFTSPQKVKGAGVWEGGDMTDLCREPSPPTVPSGQSWPGPWSLCSVWGASPFRSPCSGVEFGVTTQGNGQSCHPGQPQSDCVKAFMAGRARSDSHRSQTPLAAHVLPPERIITLPSPPLYSPPHLSSEVSKPLERPDAQYFRSAGSSVATSLRLVRRGQPWAAPRAASVERTPLCLVVGEHRQDAAMRAVVFQHNLIYGH